MKLNHLQNSIVSVIYVIIIISVSWIYLSCDSSVGPGYSAFDTGPLLFISDMNGTPQLWSMNEDGSDVKQLTFDPDIPIHDAKWSPDGTKIAISSHIPGLEGHHDFTNAIYIMNEDASGRRQITDPPTGFRIIGDGGIVWSPCGTKIAFSRHIPPEEAGKFFVYVVDLETGNESKKCKIIK